MEVKNGYLSNSSDLSNTSAFSTINHQKMGERVDSLSPNWGSESKFPQLSTWDRNGQSFSRTKDEVQPTTKFKSDGNLTIEVCKLVFFFQMSPFSLKSEEVQISLFYHFYPSRFVLCPKCIPLKFCN